MILEPEFSNDEVSIFIPKSIIEKEEDGLKLTLVGQFVGVQPILDVTQSWMKVRWSTKG